MKAGRKPNPLLTEKEMMVMKMLWEHGPLFVREMLTYYPEPKPHFNTVSTLVRILEEKGRVVEEEKISVDELKEIIRMVEEKDCPEAEK